MLRTQRVCQGATVLIRWTATLSAREREKKKTAYFSLSLDWVPAFNCSCYPVLMKECTYGHDPPHRLIDSRSDTSNLNSYSTNASYYLLDTRKAATASLYKHASAADLLWLLLNSVCPPV